MNLPVNPINWNEIEDQVDVDVWNKVVQQFWIDTKIPLSGDLKSWSSMSDEEREITKKVFVGLTALDTVQGRVGAIQMMDDTITPHEADVLTNIAFMEAFAPGTQLLSPQGWIDVEDVTCDSVVAQYTPNTGLVDFVNPTEISNHPTKTTYKFTGKKGMHVQHVSGGHRVYHKHQYGTNNPTNVQGRQNNIVIEARDLYKKGTNTRALHWVTSGYKDGELTSITDVDRLRIVLNRMGTYNPSVENEGFSSYDVPVKSKKNRAYVEDLLIRLKVPYTKPNMGSFLIAVPDSFGIKSTELEWVDLRTVSKDWCLSFFAELAVWFSATNGSLYYETSSRSDMLFVTALGTISDTSTYVQMNYPDGINVNYRINIKFGVNSSSGDRAPAPEKIDGETTVYAIQVPSTFLVTRNGELSSPVITGNCVHAKSYSSIFSTLISTQEIRDIYQWANDNEYLHEKMNLVLDRYESDDPLKKKIASTLLESFLFYSGFFWPLYLSSRAKLTNTADIIRLILADESVHGYYIGYKYQRGLEGLDESKRAEYKEFTYNLLQDLYDNEVKYTRDIYDSVGLSDQVLTFLRYNANKALANLGYEPLFPSSETQVSPAVLSALTPNSGESHDFFSGSGSSYAVGVVEDLSEDEWENIFD